MVCVSNTACWAAYLLFGVVGMATAIDTVRAIQSRRGRLLLWRLPMLLAAAWLTTSFSPSGAHASAPPLRVISEMLLFVVVWLVVGYFKVRFKISQSLGARTSSPLR